MSTNKYITLELTHDEVLELKKYYEKFRINVNHPYVLFASEKGNVRITCFFNTKGRKNKITFVGEDAFLEARLWQSDLLLEEEVTQIINPNVSQIGSDESGVGDFFGPLVVCAAYVPYEDIKLLKKYKVTDSKKMSDAYILKITPKLIKRFSYSLLILRNEKYNLLSETKMNAHEMKARLHNQALLNLKKKFPTINNIFVDQFVNEKKYYKYLQNEKEVVRNIIFETRAESSYASVALASVIARYTFLIEIEKFNKKYKLKFPLGASQIVTDFAKQFLELFGFEELNKICKKHFANYNKIIIK
ncbi:MAG: ribonuclease HIII [Bacilli bacterium]|jgi:ribonuclease HIII|nr:ribonuclease HIII [Bacilli bacterium]NLN80737.1 ribonuclease HIII [Erysipelotrichia bacterium]